MKESVYLIILLRSALSLTYKGRLRGDVTNNFNFGNSISDYETCSPSVDTCANSSSVCCHEKSALSTSKRNCRPASDCSGYPVGQYNECSDVSNYCASNKYVCCVSILGSLQGTTCLLPTECAPLVRPDVAAEQALSAYASENFHSNATCQTTYTVASGDTCDVIASKTGDSVSTILSLNPSVNSQCTNLQVGQVLCLSQLTSDPASSPVLASSSTPFAHSLSPSLFLSTHTPSLFLSTHTPSLSLSSSPSFAPHSALSLAPSSTPSSAQSTTPTLICQYQYQVYSGDTCLSIAKTTAISIATIYSLNPFINSNCTNLEVGTLLCLSRTNQNLTLAPTSVCISKYTVVRGDNCTGISAKTGVSVNTILSLNPTVNSKCTNLQIGQNLCMPSSYNTKSPTTTPSFTPTPAPTDANVTSNSNNQTLAIIIAVSVVVPLVVCLCIIFYFFFLSQKQKQNQQVNCADTNGAFAYLHFFPHMSTHNHRTRCSQSGSAHPNSGVIANVEIGREHVLTSLQQLTQFHESSTLTSGCADMEAGINGSLSYDGSDSDLLGMYTDVPVIPWSSMSLSTSNTDNTSSNIVLGKGSFGVVVKGILAKEPERNSQNPTLTIAAIKVLLAGHDQVMGQKGRNKMIKSALEEARMVLNAHKNIKYKDCITEVYGVARGAIPTDLCRAIGFADKLEGVGIVMRYEGGGTLQSLISRGFEISVTEKLRLLRDIARGLAELHEIGIIHADLKPGNILLSESNPTQIRLADFGLSIIRNKTSWDESTWGSTLRQKGTPSYCAPELLFNPYSDNTSSGEQAEIKVARPSRKTDIYAFAIVCWEVFTQIEPYSKFKDLDIMSFTCRIQQGLRPDIKIVSKGYPKQIVDMIECCWSADRVKRKYAAECKTILDYQHHLLSQSKYDVYISYDKRSNQRLTSVIYNRLTELGLKVCYNDCDQQKLQHHIRSAFYGSSETDNFITCKTFVAIIGTAYSNCEECKAEIRKFKSIMPPRLIIPVFIDPDEESWCNPELKYLLQLRSSTTKQYNISLLMQDECWLLKREPSEDVYTQLFEQIDDLARSLTIKFI